MDVNSTETVSMSEFGTKLERFGLKNQTRDEQIIYQLIEAVSRSHIKDTAEFFSVADKRGRGFITKEDFRDLFKSAALKIDERELNNFMNQFWRDEHVGIDFEGFLRIFKKYQIKLQDETRQKNMGKYVPITEDTLKLKKQYFDLINQGLRASKKSLRDMFRRVDEDGGREITTDELFTMFKNMKLDITRHQSDQIFSTMDFDNSGTISEPEL